MGGKGAIPGDNPLAVGVIGYCMWHLPLHGAPAMTYRTRDWIREVDVILVVGRVRTLLMAPTAGPCSRMMRLFLPRARSCMT
jgi:hypothetical protein